jgi:hypothetical protein
MGPMIESGARAKLTQAIGHHPFGMLFEVEEYIEPSDSLGEDEITEPFNNVSVPVRIVEQVMSAEQMRARVIPTLTEIRDALIGSMLTIFEGDFETDEASPEGETDIEVYGQTEEGLGFVFTVRVLSALRTDI